MKKIFLLFAILFNFLKGSSYAQDLELIIHLDKSNYLQYEMIQGIAELKNVSFNDFYLTNLFMAIAGTGGLELILTDENNSRILEHRREILDAYLPSAIKLAPNESLMDVLHITHWFGEKSPGMGTSFYNNRFLVPGKYKLMLKYGFQKDGNWTRISSNVVDFEIIEPNSDDLLIFNELVENSGKDFGTPADEFEGSLLKIINKYRRHDYILSAYEELFWSSPNRVTVVADSLVNQLITDHPKSFITLMLVSDGRKISEITRRDALSNLKSKNDLFFEKYIEYTSKQLEQK